MNPEKRYTTTEAAKLLSLSPSTVLRAVKDKMIKTQTTPGGHFRIPASCVEEFRLRLGGFSTEKKKLTRGARSV